ncbi:hypothetical protein AN958_05188 [Leucoagaricus sp. SymC.cos]|nr:hypothetical protein AN958_05188 [Leucoagaricus sp. SymC.cos]
MLYHAKRSHGPSSNNKEKLLFAITIHQGMPQSAAVALNAYRKPVTTRNHPSHPLITQFQ